MDSVFFDTPCVPYQLSTLLYTYTLDVHYCIIELKMSNMLPE